VPKSHPLFWAIVVVGASLGGCRTQPLGEKPDAASEDLKLAVADLATVDLACDCAVQPLPEHCRIPCILI